jgi:acyl carrier protein
VDRDAIIVDLGRVIDEVLELEGRGESLTGASQLLGAMPEFDSMAVVSLITALEERYGFSVDDDEISGETFETVGSLADFVARKRLEASA